MEKLYIELKCPNVQMIILCLDGPHMTSKTWGPRNMIKVSEGFWIILNAVRLPTVAEMLLECTLEQIQYLTKMHRRD